jgi:serine protease Do
MRWIIGAIVALLVAGPCTAESLKVVVPEPITTPPPPSGASVRSVSLTRVAANIAPGTAWRESTGSPYFFVPCLTAGDIDRWQEADNKVTSIETFERIFRTELGAAGFRAGGDPTNLFEQQSSSDLQIGALVTALQVKTCTYVGIGNTVQGAVTMDVDWQIYSVTQARVVARILTHGGVTRAPSRDLTTGALVSAAFGDNIRRLAADDRFRTLVLDTPAQSGRPPSQTAVMSVILPPAAKAMPLDTSVQGVVSIFAGDGWGSGVLISSEGYLLTNHHVVGDAGKVRVHWPDGSDTVGEIIRADRRRDVALIKTTPPKVQALSIRHAPVELGETVYAVGTPREKEFAGTLTRGVVSTVNRQIEGQRYIQSDVAMTFGNSGGPLLDEKGWIVGLSDLTYAPDGVSTNINFFIPIGEALSVLGITPG